jgi:hypothetical protein
MSMAGELGGGGGGGFSAAAVQAMKAIRALAIESGSGGGGITAHRAEQSRGQSCPK